MNPPPLPPSRSRSSSTPRAALCFLLLVVVGCLLAGYLNFDLFKQSATRIFQGLRPRSVARSTPDHANQGTDAIFREAQAYRYSTRMAYNARRFDELETLADTARSTRARFGNGSWKLYQFYGAFACADTEPESMWELHKEIHQAWIAAKPNSLTARVALLDFLVEYAWHARGSGYADTITAAGGRLFEARLHEAHRVLDESKALAGKAPDWWSAGMRLALGEGWPRRELEDFYAQGKSAEPNYFNFDTLRSNFLATKWYGQPGDWEAAANEASVDPAGLGLEIYARCVLVQYANYRNIFQETNATWVNTQAGFELMRQRYPDSLEVASAYCRVACLAGDRPTAKRLFDLLGEQAFSNFWFNLENLRRDRAWANQT